MSERNLYLNKIKYYVVPTSRNRNSAHGKIQDKIFDYWVEQWGNNFKNSKPKEGWQDHFLRMSLVTALEYENQIIGCLLFRFYNFDAHSSLKSEYFSYIDKNLVKNMSGDGLKDAMSVEYLSIDPAWSKNSMNVSLGKIIIALSSYVAEQHNADCIISMPIGGTKVDKMLENIGAMAIQEDIKKYGYTLKLMMTKTKPATKGIDIKVRAITDTIWENRIDYSMTNLSEKAA